MENKFVILIMFLMLICFVGSLFTFSGYVEDLRTEIFQLRNEMVDFNNQMLNESYHTRMDVYYARRNMTEVERDVYYARTNMSNLAPLALTVERLAMYEQWGNDIKDVAAADGVYFFPDYYMTWTGGYNYSQINDTVYHEECHNLVDKNYDHFLRIR